MEAARALGMTQFSAINRIILPQAFRIVIPPVTNDFIALFKDTSVCSVVTVVELTKRYSILALSTGQIVQLAAITSVLYLLMSYPLSVFARWSERRLAEGRQEGGWGGGFTRRRGGRRGGYESGFSPFAEPVRTWMIFGGADGN